MLCSRFLQPPHGRSSTAGSTAHSSASSTACCDVYDCTLRVGAAPSAWSTHGVVARWCWSATVLPVHARCRRASFPDEDTGQIFGITEGGAGHLVRRDGAAPAAGRRRSSPRIPNVDAFIVERRRGGSAASRQHRAASSSRLKPRDERAAHAGPDHRGAAAEARRDSRHPRLPAESAADPHRRPGRAAACTSSRCKAPTSRSCTSARRRLREARCAQLPGLADVTSDLQITSPQVNVEIDRDRASALGVTADQIENALYNAYGPRQVSTIYAPDQRVPGDPGSAARVPARSRRALDCSTSRSDSGKLVPLDTVAQLRTRTSGR